MPSHPVLRKKANGYPLPEDSEQRKAEYVESLMRLNRGAVPGNPGAGRDSGKQEISDEEYNRMTPTERINYARQQSKR